jgi:predicted HD phosphohydrolase
MHTPETILALYRERGAIAYDGEGVTQLQHAWQCGCLALEAGAVPALRLAAWCHDLGHLLTGLPGSPTTDGIDDRHELLGSQVLGTVFGIAVVAPVALHVAAKRYLVATQPHYCSTLSPDSLRSLALQGGAMTAQESTRFERARFADDAQALRRWDDLAKKPGLGPHSTDQALAQLADLMRVVQANAHV